MKLFANFLLTVLVALPLMFTAGPVAAADTGEAEAIVQESNQAVREALAQLQSVVTLSNQEISDLSMQLLDLAVTNSAVASDFLAALEAGQAVNEEQLANCRIIAQQIRDAVAQLAAGELKTAQATFAAVQTLAAGQPAPANPGQIPSGLEDISDQLTTTMTSAGARGASNTTSPPSSLENPPGFARGPGQGGPPPVTPPVTPPDTPPVNPPASGR